MIPEPHAPPLIQRLTDAFGFPALSGDDADRFIGEPGAACLFFPGDYNRLDESADVAVVLPELIAAFDGRLRAGVITDKDTERSLQRRFRFNAFPALVFTRDGGWLGTIQRMQDWSDYMRDIHTILAGNPQEPPAYEFPEACIPSAQPRTH